MTNYLKMEGKHVLITGAGSGIGRQTAILLSRLGARVSIIGRRKEMLKETLSMLCGDGHVFCEADISKIEELESMILGIIREKGAVDGFVHCAGSVKSLPLINYSYERLHDIMLVNFYSYFEIVRILSKKKSFNKGMSIVGVSSVQAIRGATAQAAYGASKAAMNGAMHCLARELGEKGIRLNTVLPAATDTEMYRDFISLKANMKGTDMKIEATPRQYLGINTTEDVANAIIFLLSPASQKITGIEFPVDGGFTSC